MAGNIGRRGMGRFDNFQPSDPNFGPAQQKFGKLDSSRGFIESGFHQFFFSWYDLDLRYHWGYTEMITLERETPCAKGHRAWKVRPDQKGLYCQLCNRERVRTKYRTDPIYAAKQREARR